MQGIKNMVSVVMPVYNAERYIARAIDSILGQTHSNLELVIIDDCSTDKSMLIVNQYNDSRIRIIHNESNKGIAYSRNAGISHSRGEFIALMDDDDISMRERFELQVAFLRKHEDVDIVGGRAQWIDENDKPLSDITNVYFDSNMIKAKFLLYNAFWNCEVMFRKAIVEKYGYWYQDDMYGMEDYHFWIRYSKMCKMSNINELVLQHRKSDSAETNRVSKYHKDERRKIFNELRKMSIEMSGIMIPSTTLYILNYFFNSADDGQCTNIYEAEQLFHALAEMVSQGYAQRLEYADEIASVCKEYFVEMMKKSNIMWW